eukprot:COSAG05_NODE_1609_length_4412_cov_2.348018_1_plen_69_part_10
MIGRSRTSVRLRGCEWWILRHANVLGLGLGLGLPPSFGGDCASAIRAGAILSKVYTGDISPGTFDIDV